LPPASPREPVISRGGGLVDDIRGVRAG